MIDVIEAGGRWRPTIKGSQSYPSEQGAWVGAARVMERERDEALALLRQLVLVEAKRTRQLLTPTEQGLALIAWNNASALLHQHGLLVPVDTPPSGDEMGGAS